MGKIVVLVPFRARHQAQILAALPPDSHVVFASDDLTAEEQILLLRDAEIVIGEPETEAIEASEALRWVQITWSGTDKYTGSGKTFPAQIRLTNMRGAYGSVMSEYALAMILSFYRRLFPYRRNQERHEWLDLGTENSLAGKTALIFGAGNIGVKTAEKLKTFRTFNVGVRRSAGGVSSGFDEMCSLAQAEAWLPRADLVVCCIPESPETYHYFNEARLSLLKKDALLVNMGRGSFVETNALVKLLSEGHLLGAALDVVEPEPLPPEHPLWDMENVVLTPHIAGAGFGHCPETEDKIADICCENLNRYASGLPLINLIR
jgi:phosphoglycerate dehydrogenase-like enzyme